MILHLGKIVNVAVLPKLTALIPAAFVDGSDWGISESLRMAHENFNSRNTIDILLGDSLFFEVRHPDKKTRP
jgi:hypothetical protein